MFCGQIISSDIPTLHLQDSVESALMLMDDRHLEHLPIVENDKYIGLLSEDDILDIQPEKKIIEISDLLMNVSVRSADYFTSAVKCSYQYDLDIVPVATEHQEFEGVIRRNELFMLLAKISGSEELGSLLILEMPKSEYSPGQFNKLVESNDAVVTHLNSWYDHATGVMTVQLRINKEEISDIIASFQRFGYTIRFYQGEELYKNELHSNLDNLFNYLNI